MFAGVKKYPGYAFIVGISLLLYAAGMISGLWLTPSRFLNIVYSTHIFGLVCLFLYYLYYRYVDEEISLTAFQKYFYLVVSAIMLSGALAVWGYHHSDMVRILLKSAFPIPIIQSYLKIGSITAPPVRMLLILYSGAGVFSLIFYGTIRINGWLTSGEAVRRLLNTSYFLFIVSILAYLFSTNLTLTNPGVEHTIFQGGTKAQVLDRIQNEVSFVEDLELAGGFNYILDEAGKPTPYVSRTGFYGSVLKLAQQLMQISPGSFLTAARIVYSALTASVFSLIALALKKNKGMLASFFFILPVPFTFWILGPAKILIWTLFLFFVPSLLSLMLYPQVLRHKITFRLFCIVMFLSFFFVFLHAYEFISCVILSAVVPVIYYELSSRSTWLNIIRRGFFICLAGLGAFLIAFFLHFIQLSVFRGSTELAWLHFSSKSVERTIEDGISYWEMFLQWLNVPVFYFSEEHFVHSYGRPFLRYQPAHLHKWNSLGFLYIIFVLLAGITAILKHLGRKVWKSKTAVRRNFIDNFNLAITGGAALIASWSWFLAKGHMAGHLHQNGIMFMIPFVPVFFIFIGFLVHAIIELILLNE